MSKTCLGYLKLVVVPLAILASVIPRILVLKTIFHCHTLSFLKLSSGVLLLIPFGVSGEHKLDVLDSGLLVAGEVEEEAGC